MWLISEQLYLKLSHFYVQLQLLLLVEIHKFYLQSSHFGIGCLDFVHFDTEWMCVKKKKKITLSRFLIRSNIFISVIRNPPDSLSIPENSFSLSVSSYCMKKYVLFQFFFFKLYKDEKDEVWILTHRGFPFQFSDKQYKASHEKRQQRQRVRFPEFNPSTVLSASAVCCGCLTVCVMAQAFDSDQLTVTDSCGDIIRHHHQVPW